MKIEEILLQLHDIQPDQDHVRASRARLMLAIRPRFERVTFRSLVIGVLRSGSAMAVTGLLLVLAIGGFSLWNMFGSLTGWDSNTLMAEAQAIDIQIHLAELQYKDGGYGRQRLISPEPDFSAEALVSADDADESESGEEQPAGVDDVAVSDPDGSEGDNGDADGATSTSTDPAAEDGDNATSTPEQEPEPEPDPVDVEDALDILSR